MATYINQTKRSAIASVEFSPQPEGNLSFYHLSDDTFSQVGYKTNKDNIRDFLTGTLGQEIVGESEINGRPVIIARGDKSQQDIVTALESRGDKLILPQPKHEFRPWVWRGNLSMVGQALQLTSSLLAASITKDGEAYIGAEYAKRSGGKALSENAMRKLVGEIKAEMPNTKFTDTSKGNFEKKGFDVATGMFASANIGANLTNIAFGAEKIADPHQLRWLKENFNKKLALYLPETALPAPEEKRAPLRKEPPKPRSYDQKFRDFMQRNSVTVGEIGLRYIGATALAFPMKLDKWKSIYTKKTPEGKPIYKTDPLGKPINGPDGKPIERSRFGIAYNYEDQFTGRAGLAYLIGKTVAFFSKVPDPFDPKPHTWVDTMREKVLFRISSATEAVAAATIAYDRYRTRRIILPQWKIFGSKAGTVTRDWFGVTGGVLFMGGLVIRIFAPFGSKVMNMEELNAHITDGLARVPREKLPQLIIETAASIKEHFKDKVPEMSQIYTQLATDLYRYHHISLPEGAAKTALAAETEKDQDTATKIFANDDLKKSPVLAGLQRPASHQEKAAMPSQGVALGAS